MTPFKKYYIITIAATEFEEARKWYASHQVKGLSSRFAQSVKTSIQRILMHPTAYAVRYNNVRIAHTDKFPYAIHFYIDKDMIIITAIIFNGRNPRTSMQRME